MTRYNILLVTQVVALFTQTSRVTSSGLGNEYTEFHGSIIGLSSWFNATRWAEYPTHPSENDTVLIDDPYNTYINIDDGEAQAASLILGANTMNDTCETSVQLDVVDTLTVETDLVLGGTSESDAVLYVADTGTIHIFGDMIVGDHGSGVVMNDGDIFVNGNLVIGQDLTTAIGTMHVAGKVYAANLEMPHAGSRLQLSPGANIVLQGTDTDMDTIQAYIEEGKLAPSDASGGLVYAVYDCTRKHTIIHASESHPDMAVAGGSAATTTTRRAMFI